MRTYKKWSAEDEILLVSTYPSTKSSELAGVFGVSEHTLEAKAYRLRLKKNDVQPWRRTHSYNDRFFQTIDSEEKAYWLGFVWADGSVHGSSMTISLSAKDGYHLYKFKQAVNHTAELDYDKRGAVCIGINSMDIVRDLFALNVVPNKTYAKLEPTQLPQHLTRHFVRGLFDGDGGITIKHNGVGLSRIKITGSDEICWWVKNLLSNELMVGGSVYPKNDSAGFSDYQIGGRYQLERVAKWMYGNATVYMERKYRRFVEGGYYDPS